MPPFSIKIPFPAIPSAKLRPLAAAGSSPSAVISVLSKVASKIMSGDWAMARATDKKEKQTKPKISKQKFSCRSNFKELMK